MKYPVYAGLPLQLLPVSYYTSSLIQNDWIRSKCHNKQLQNHTLVRIYTGYEIITFLCTDSIL